MNTDLLKIENLEIQLRGAAMENFRFHYLKMPIM